MVGPDDGGRQLPLSIPLGLLVSLVLLTSIPAWPWLYRAPRIVTKLVVPTLLLLVIFFGGAVLTGLLYPTYFKQLPEGARFDSIIAGLNTGPAILSYVSVSFGAAYVFYVAGILASLAVSYLEHAIRSSRARVSAISALVSALNALNIAADRFAADKSDAIPHLVRASRYLKLGVRRDARNLPSMQYVEYRRKVAQLSATIESWTMRIAFSDSADIDNLRESVCLCIWYLSLGLEGQIELIEEEGVKTRRILGRLMDVARSLIIAVTPVALFEAISFIGVPIAVEWDGPILIACLVWAAVTLFMLIDPNLTARINSTKDLISVLRGKSD